MRSAIFIISFLFVAIFTFAQQNNILPNIPRALTNNASGIAGFINTSYHRDDQKIAAIYNWITHNINYDADSIHYVILDEDNDQRVSVVLRRKRGVCENFAALFNDLCKRCGIRSYTIEGYTRQGGATDRTPHVWCAAYSDGEWNLYDPTWDAGYIRNGNYNAHRQNIYFKISPEVFIQTHLPFDPLFQFLDFPVTYKEFVTGRTGEKGKKYFNYKDSLDSFRNRNLLEQYLSAISRIKESNWPASKIDTKLKRLRLEVEVLYQDKDADLYNLSVADYNQAVDYLNNFIAYRNNQFQPAKTNEELQKIFTNIRIRLNRANANLKEVNSSRATLTLNTGELQKKLDDLQIQVKQQELFMKSNLSLVK